MGRSTRRRSKETTTQFNSVQYAVFLVVVLTAYRVVDRRWRVGVLFAASWAFYATVDWRLLGLIAVSTTIDWAAALGIDRARQEGDAKTAKALVSISVAVNLGILATFKYFDFFIASIGGFLETIGIGAPDITLNLIVPVGLSFYTFQSMSYSIDVHRGTIRAERSFLLVAAFVSFFPQLLAGPIERAGSLIPQLRDSPDRPRPDQILEGIELLVIGLFKKVAVADVMFAVLVDAFAGSLGNGFALAPVGWSTLLLGVMAFAVQLYCDFSGYSDMARGSAKLFGIELSRNFLRPKNSRSVRDFWQRWHITFMRFIRDYVLRPLGGLRGSSSRVLLNVTVVFLLTGLWHGGRATTLVWGGLLAVLFAVDLTVMEAARKARTARKASGPPSPITSWIRRFLAIASLTLTGPLLVLPGLREAGEFYGALFSFRDGPFELGHLLAVGYGCVCVWAIDRHQHRFETDELLRSEQRRGALRAAGEPSPNDTLRDAGGTGGTVSAIGTAVMGANVAAAAHKSSPEPAPDLLLSWGWQARTAAMVLAIVLFGSNALAAEFYYFQF